MNEIEPRFEFRAWAPDLGMVEARMRGFSPCQGVRESDEVYIVSAGSDETNIKIRDALMDMKLLVQERDGLEQWRPSMKGAFPMTAEALAAEVFPAFGVAMPALVRDEYTLDQCLDEIIRPHRDLVAVAVFKRRSAFTVNDCIAEHAEVRIDDAALQTVAVESTDIAKVLEARRMLGLDGHENVNYLRAIKRAIGMAPVPH